MPDRKEVAKILGWIAFAVILASCMTQQTRITPEANATLPPTTALAIASPTPQPSQTATATEILPTATETLQPTDTVVPTDWSNLRCVPTSPDDISRCPQSPSPVTEKDKFIGWFAKWVTQMDTYKLGPSVAYGISNVDDKGSHHDIITVASGGLAGTFWFAGQNGQIVLVIALANGLVNANNLYQGQYNLIALVDKTSYQGVIGGSLSQAEEINSIQPNVSAYVTTLNLQDDGNNYLEKAVAENYPNGVLADGSTLRVGFIWKMEK